MDPTLVGVIIGSVLSLAGTFATQWLTMQKEEKHWHRQHEAEEEKRIRDEQKACRENLRNMYHNCIRVLSLIVTAGSRSASVELTDEERSQLYQEAHKSLTSLSLHLRDSYSSNALSNFLSEFSIFTEYGDKTDAKDLRNQVIELAMNDKELFPRALLLETEEPADMRIQIQIDNDFRRQQFVEGVELPDSYEFSCDFSDLTTEQRQKLWDTYEKAPHNLYSLPIPRYDGNKKQIILKGGGWAARLNPLTTDPKEILNAWEADYDKALENAQKEYNIHSEKA